MAEYIEREALIKRLEATPILKYGIPTYVRDGVIDLVAKQPAADVEPAKRGRWLPQIVLGQKAWDCSECKTLGSPHWKRCPVCEAKMEVSDG